MGKNIVVVGSSGAIGSKFVQMLTQTDDVSSVYAFSGKYTDEKLPNVIYHTIDYDNEESIAKAAEIASQNALVDIVIIALGALHKDSMMPEKSLKELSVTQFEYFFKTNAITPALIIKHFSKVLQKDRAAIIAALSARVGSISDNKLGGWYSYRASKAALNMVIKNAAIEIARTHKKSIIVGLHPGTVDSNLSKPFQKNVPAEKLFSPEFSVAKLTAVMQNLTTTDSGKCFAWDGSEIQP